jgi:hypothetical protein
MSHNTLTAGRPKVWAAPHLLTAKPTGYAISLGIRLLLLLAFASADVVLVKTTIDLVLDQQEAISWFIAVVLSIGSVTIMVKAGFLYRTAEGDGHGRAWVFALVAAYVLIGLALVIMRMNAAQWTESAIAVEGQLGAVDETAKHQGIALLLAMFYIAAGALAFFDGLHDLNPTAIAYLALRPRVERLAGSITAQRSVVARAAEDLERAKGNLAGLEAARAAAENALRYRAAELMALARIRIANAIADPQATGVTEIAPEYPAISRSAQAGKDAR